jgi:hypothetical protein
LIARLSRAETIGRLRPAGDRNVGPARTPAPQESPPTEVLQGFIDGELMRWSKVVKSAGLAATE